jgi:hypothetical protein
MSEWGCPPLVASASSPKDISGLGLCAAQHPRYVPAG